MTRNQWLLVAGVLLLLLTIYRLSSSGEGLEVKAARAKPAVISESVLASGTFLFSNQADLSPEIIGKVTRIYVREGDLVGAGQPLLEIERGVYVAAMRQQAAVVTTQHLNIREQQLNLQLRSRELARLEALAQSGFVTRVAMENARTARDSATLQLSASRANLRHSEAALSQAIEQLNLTTIRSPNSGTVTSVDIKVGETAVPSTIGIAGSSLVTIADIAKVIAEVNVDESNIANVAIGQRAEIQAPAFPGQKILGTVDSIALSYKKPDMALGGAAGGGQARTYTVKLLLSVPSRVKLRPGMSCRAEIFSSARKRPVTVPIQAVRYDEAPTTNWVAGRRETSAESRYYVFVIKDGKAVRRSITMGVTDDQKQEILSGLSAGELVVEGPYKTLRFLREGDALSINRPGSRL